MSLQLPASQVCPTTQAAPQLPQLVGSLAKSAQPPAQAWLGATQVPALPPGIPGVGVSFDEQEATCNALAKSEPQISHRDRELFLTLDCCMCEPFMVPP